MEGVVAVKSVILKEIKAFPGHHEVQNTVNIVMY